MEVEIKKVQKGRYILLPISDETRGHGTHSIPKIWGNYLEELMRFLSASISESSCVQAMIFNLFLPPF